ncbi:MAG: hypothetical protein KDK12_16460 [Rhodobacteraceae bacterium]|nr:hypothetical protein [Paracoccaceae bacterium]
MNDAPPGWEGLLAPDERILWQGRPGTGLIWSDLLSRETLMGAYFIVFSSLWLWGTTFVGTGIPRDAPAQLMARVFPVFGSIFWLVGLYLLIGRLVWDSFVRARSTYTLTTDAAYVATQVLGRRRLTRYPSGEMRGLELVDGRPGTVWFMREVLTSRSGGTRRTHARRIGFRRIDEARRVWDLMEPHRNGALQ